MDRRRAGPRGDRRPRQGFQRKNDVARALEALDGVLLEAVAHDSLDRRWHVRRVRQLGRFLRENRRHRIGGGLARERPAAGQHLVEDRTKGEEIGARVDRQTSELFGGHVADRPHDHAGIGAGNRFHTRGRLVWNDLTRQAEVEDLHLPVLQQEDVLRLQVPMDQASGVRGRQATGNLDRNLDRLARGNRTGVQAIAQRFALEELRDGEELSVVDAGIEDRQDVGVRERRDRLRLALEAGAPILIGRDAQRQHFDGDVSRKPRIAGAVHFAHATRAEGGRDGVRTEAGAGAQRHGLRGPLFSLLAGLHPRSRGSSRSAGSPQPQALIPPAPRGA